MTPAREYKVKVWIPEANTAVLEAICVYCGKTVEIQTKCTDYWLWTNGELIQDCLSYLTVSQREMLISGICEGCWELI
jgi:hypothetical protein